LIPISIKMASSKLSVALTITALTSAIFAAPQRHNFGGRSSGGPCDIYKAGGTPCVAAHGTTRALYGSYNGALYQVTRSDGSTKDIHPRSAGGVADGDSQDSFCSGKSCTITKIYDQSGQGNHLTPAPPGGAASGPGPNGYDNPADASAAAIQVNGKKAYGVYVTPGVGYRNDKTTGVATGDAPEGIYAVLDGTRYSSNCCFDYGNAETNAKDNGAGHMVRSLNGEAELLLT
jgi:non-reducing end alpha-L-arabinofuranosidase